jgi:hypothetical protein
MLSIKLDLLGIGPEFSRAFCLTEGNDEPGVRGPSTCSMNSRPVLWFRGSDSSSPERPDQHAEHFRLPAGWP